jgi:hypothetical protein
MTELDPPHRLQACPSKKLHQFVGLFCFGTVLERSRRIGGRASSFPSIKNHLMFEFS